MMMAGDMRAARAVPGPRVKREIGVQGILEWAFGRECARLELDATARITGQAAPSFGTEYVIMQRLALGGVKIDTFRGTSEPHEDAEIVAAMVQGLPVALGGMPMALRIAELARDGITPDWMPGAVPRLQPREWKRDNQFADGEGRTDVAEVWVERFSVRHPRNPERLISRTRRHEIRYTPCTWKPSPSQVSMAHDDYDRWWTALARIRDMLMLASLRDHVVVERMPAYKPWRNGD